MSGQASLAVKDEAYYVCQAAREYGTIFSDEFLRWCFSDGHYSLGQMIWDTALLLVMFAVGGAIIWYWVGVFRSG